MHKEFLNGSFMLEACKPTVDQLVKQTILRALDQLEVTAEVKSKCKYRPEGCIILDIDLKNEIITHYTEFRSPCIASQSC